MIVEALEQEVRDGRIEEPVGSAQLLSELHRYAAKTGL